MPHTRRMTNTGALTPAALFSASLDTLTSILAEHAGRDVADETERRLYALADAHDEGEDTTDRLGSLTAYLTTILGSMNMITLGIDDLITDVTDTLTMTDPDAVEKSWEPYALTFDGARYAE